MMIDGQREDDDQRGGQVEEEDDADHAHRDGELDDLFLERRNRAVDQVGPVIGGDDLHARRKRGRDIGPDLLFDAVDHLEDVLAEADDDDAARHLALAVDIGGAPAYLRTELNIRHVF